MIGDILRKILGRLLRVLGLCFFVCVFIIIANIFVQSEKQKTYVIKNPEMNVYLVDSFVHNGDTTYLFMVEENKEKYIISKTKK